jgi:KipI family sensor histidine kinase inhibitor
MSEPAENLTEIRNVGVDGLLVSFGAGLSEPANRAALAFRHALERAGWDGVVETTTSLVSAYLRFDPLAVARADLVARLEGLLAERDWHDASLPAGRKLWRIPTVYEGEHAPQLAEAAKLAGVSVAQAIADLSTTPLRVQTIGFAPGQPYLGQLPRAWDIPRQTALTKQVPVGAVTVAIRQIVLFSVSAPTGWRHVGQTALRLFRPDADDPFVLRPGDEALFEAVGAEALARLRQDPDGGATWTALT